MTPDDLISAAIDVAEEGRAQGELPIGAVVEMGGRIISRAFTRDMSLGRRLVHADLLAMIAADEELGWGPRPDLPWYAAPTITGGIRRADTLVALPEPPV